MKQADIDKITSEILELNKDKSKMYEFICALANAKSFVENKLSTELLKTANEAAIRSLFNKLK